MRWLRFVCWIDMNVEPFWQQKKGMETWRQIVVIGLGSQKLLKLSGLRHIYGECLR